MSDSPVVIGSSVMTGDAHTNRICVLGVAPKPDLPLIFEYGTLPFIHLGNLPIVLTFSPPSSAVRFGMTRLVEVGINSRVLV
jgi:hypothetical protein